MKFQEESKLQKISQKIKKKYEILSDRSHKTNNLEIKRLTRFIVVTVENKDPVITETDVRFRKISLRFVNVQTKLKKIIF